LKRPPRKLQNHQKLLQLKLLGLLGGPITN